METARGRLRTSGAVLGAALTLGAAACGGTAHAALPPSPRPPPPAASPSPEPSPAPRLGDGVVPRDPPGPSVKAPFVPVPILMYHYVRVVSQRSDPLGYGLSVTPAQFATQMGWLASHGYHPVSLEGLNLYLEGRAYLPPRPLVLTFDDGYEDFYTAALPVLEAHGFTAVSFIITNRIDTPGYMTTSQLQALDGIGIEIGCHTVSHPDLSLLTVPQLQFQLRHSESVLTALLGHPVPDFAYPSGDFDAQVVEQVREAGYRDAVTTVYGAELAVSPAARYTWPRVRVEGGESLTQYAYALAQTSA